MKKILITLLVLLCTLGASALEFDEDRFHYATITGSTDSETGLIHVRLTGVASGMLFSYDDRVRIPGYVTHNGTTYLVEEIATGAFANIPNLHYVQIGYGVRRIATYAFLDTNFAIRGIYLPSSVKTVEGQAFYVASNCAITLMHLKNLPTFASNWMLGLQSGQFNVYVPTQAQVDDVENAQFFKTVKPKSITVTPSVACDISQVLDGFRYYSVFVQEPTALQEGKLAVVGYSNESSTFNGFLIAAASSNYATVGSGVKRSYYTEIADSAFMGSFSTYSGKVQISGSHLERIGEGAFANCAMLEAVSIYDVPVIAMRAFYNCTNLKTLNLDTGIERIEFEAFYGGAYEKVTIPGTVTFIDYTAFTYSSLKNYGVMSSNNTFSTYKGMLFNKAQTTLLSIPTMTPNTIIDASCLPTTLKSIGTYAGRSNKTVTDVNLPYGVTTIRNAAFGFMESVKSVRLPSSITSCGYHVFCYTKDFDLCFAWLDNIPRTIEEELLEYSTPTIYIPNAKAQDLYSASPAFEGQTFNVDPMKAYDFMDVATPSDGGVVAVTSCVTKAATSSADGEAAIVGGTGKLRINMGDGVPAYYPNYDGKYYIYKSVYENAFKDNSDITEVSINSSYLTSIGDSAFRKAPNITSININAPATIGACAFMETPATSITLNSVTSLGKQAFYHASACPKLTIPASVTSIGDRALVAMNGTQTFTVNSSNPNYSSDSHGFIYNKDKSKLVVVPGATTYTVLNDVSFPNAMKEIDSYAFYWNLAVKDVRVPYGVTKIGDEAFVGAENLENLHIPSSADLGNSFRLYGCMSLKYLTINQEVPPTLGSNGLVYVNSNCYVYVPLRPQSSISDHDEARVGQYKDNAQWSRLSVRYGAYDFIDDNLAYTVQADGTLAVVQAKLKGNIVRPYDTNGNLKKSITVPEKVTYRGNTYTVTALDNAAFKDNTAVESITLPNTITDFKGERAWDIYLDYMNSGMQFRGCTSLKSIKLPSNIKAIPAECFQDTKIEKLTLPYGIESIGTYAFKNAEIGELLIPSSCQRFWYNQLIYVSRLDRLILNVPFDKYSAPSNLDLGIYKETKSALSNTRVNVPLTSLDEYSSVDFFAEVKSVRAGAYDFKVNGGAGGYLTVTGTQAANDARALAPSQVPSVAPLAKFVQGPDQTLVTSVAMGLVEDDVYTDKHYNATDLDVAAFSGATNLNQFSLNGIELTAIPKSAFSGCTSLKSFPFESPLQSIGVTAFYNSGLSDAVILPESVTDIGENAFNCCAGINILQLPYLPNESLLGKHIYFTGMNQQFACYADRRNFHMLEYTHDNVYPYLRENSKWTTIDIRKTGNYYYQVEDIIRQGGELYIIGGVSNGVISNVTKVLSGQRVDKSGERGYVARIEPGKTYLLTPTTTNDVSPELKNVSNIIYPRYSLNEDRRPVPQLLSNSYYEVDPTSSDLRFLRCQDGGVPQLCYGYLSAQNAPDVITAGYARGDVNGDGTVGIGDIVAITNIMAGIETNPDYIARADVNGDQSIGIGDIVTITNIMAGIE